MLCSSPWRYLARGLFYIAMRSTGKNQRQETNDKKQVARIQWGKNNTGKSTRANFVRPYKEKS